MSVDFTAGHFDPACVVQAFLANRDEVVEIRGRYGDGPAAVALVWAA